MKTILPKNQRGLSLVELMVAMVLGLILMSSVGGVYISSKQSYRTTEAVSRVQENGRFSITKLAEDLRMSGFMGCGAGGLSVTNNLTSTSPPYDFTIGVEGTDGASNAPDTITIKYATNFNLKVTQIMASAGADLKVTANDNISQNNIVLVCDVVQGDIFQVTGTSGGSGTMKDTVSHATGSGTPGNSVLGLSKSYDVNARIFGLTSVVYSIAPGAGIGSPPALFRNDGVTCPLSANGCEIAENVENMQVVYGVDTSVPEDGAADVYQKAGSITAANWTRVVSARVSLLIRTNETNLTETLQSYVYDLDGDGIATTETALDNRIRRVYTVTVNLRNRAI